MNSKVFASLRDSVERKDKDKDNYEKNRKKTDKMSKRSFTLPHPSVCAPHRPASSSDVQRRTEVKKKQNHQHFFSVFFNTSFLLLYRHLFARWGSAVYSCKPRESKSLASFSLDSSSVRSSHRDETNSPATCVPSSSSVSYTSGHLFAPFAVYPSCFSESWNT